MSDFVSNNGTYVRFSRFTSPVKKLIDENEHQFGKEIREKNGEDRIDQSIAKLQNLTEAEFEEATRLAKVIQETLAEAFTSGDPSSDIAQKAADLHKQWLTIYWSEYSKEDHSSLAQMYMDDERFKAYFDKKALPNF